MEAIKNAGGCMNKQSANDTFNEIAA